MEYKFWQFLSIIFMKCYEVKKLKKLDKMSIRCYYNNITTNMEE